MKPKLSALVITKNEEINIKDCLESIKWVDEIVIIDDFSSDKTLKIAKRYTKNIFKRKFDFPPNQKQFGLKKTKNDWVLVIDADERINSKLKTEILKKIESSDFVAYHTYFKTVFLGKIFSASNSRTEGTQRLFKKSKAKFLLNTSHEKLIINGQVGVLDEEFLHFTTRSITQALTKINQRSSIEALELYQAGGKTNLAMILLAPARMFIKRYFLERNILNGMEGFIFSLLQAHFYLYKHLKIWELSLNREKKM